MECNPIIDVSNVGSVHIYLGVFDTFNARVQQFDLTAWQQRLGEGVFSVNLLRPGDTVPYAVAKVSIDDATATWTFDATDTAFSGYGKVFLSYAGDGFLEKTVDITVYIAKNCGPAGDTPPDPLENWYSRMLGAAARAQDAARRAEVAAGDLQIGGGLKWNGSTLEVDASNTVQAGDTRPVTSAAVAVEVGNINALLQTI